MARSPPKVDDLVLKIHSAAFAEHGWDEIVAAVCHGLSANGASLVRPSRLAEIQPWCHLYERDPVFLTEYAQHWSSQDQWYQGAVRTGRTGVGLVNRDSQLIDRRDFERSPFYNDFLRRGDIDRMMNVCLAAPDEQGRYGSVALSVYRGVGKKEFSEQDHRVLLHLAPHLAVAAKNYGCAKALRLLASARHDALNALTCAIFALSASGAAVFANDAGDEMLRRNRWFSIRDGNLTAAERVRERVLLEKSLQLVRQGCAFNSLVTESVSGAQAMVYGNPLSPSSMGPYSDEARALVWLVPIQSDSNTSALMAQLFRLSAAETRLLARLISGEELRDAAMNLRISPHTARTQLKAIFDKTGRRTQSALLSLAGRLSVLNIPLNPRGEV